METWKIKNYSRRSMIGAGVALGISAVFPGCSRAKAALKATSQAKQLIEAAREQIGVTLHYDPAYSALAFPGGDVDRAKGVCTDVIIRAYRDALGIDLQQLVNEDMRSDFAAYPKNWGLKKPDKNIDHRRVPNLQTFWSRAGAEQAISSEWQPGDIFTSMVDGRLAHTGIVSDRIGRSGQPMIIHNIGRGTREEDALMDHRLTGHYRWRMS